MSIRSLTIKQFNEPQIAGEQESSPEARKLPSPLLSRHTVKSSSKSLKKRSLKRFLLSKIFNLKRIDKPQSIIQRTSRPVVSSNSPSLSGLKTQSPILSPEEQRLPSPSSSSSFGTNRIMPASSFSSLSPVEEMFLPSAHSSEEQRLPSPSPSRHSTIPSSSSSSPSYPSPPHSSSSPSRPSPSPSLSSRSPYTEKHSYAKKLSSRSPSPRGWKSPSNSSLIRSSSSAKNLENRPPASSPRLRMLKSLHPIKQPIYDATKPSSSPQNQPTAPLLLRDLHSIVERQHKHLKRQRANIEMLRQNYLNYTEKEVKDICHQVVTEGAEIIFPLHKIFNSKLNASSPQRTSFNKNYISDYVQQERTLFTEAFFITMKVLDTKIKHTLTYDRDFNNYFSKLAYMTRIILWTQNTRCLNASKNPAAINLIFENVQYFVAFISQTYPTHEHFKLKQNLLRTLAPFFKGREDMLKKLNTIIFLS